jgi:CRP-like cAMP-binding protein
MGQHEAMLGLLRRTELCHDLDTSILQLVAQRLTEHTYDAGQVVFHEGEAGDRLFLLLSGMMHVYVERGGKAINYATIHPGECFGEMALVDGTARSATVRAQTPSRCFALSKQDFLDIIQRYPHIALRVIQSLSRRLRQTSTRLQELTMIHQPQA